MRLRSPLNETGAVRQWAASNVPEPEVVSGLVPGPMGGGTEECENAQLRPEGVAWEPTELQWRGQQMRVRRIQWAVLALCLLFGLAWLNADEKPRADEEGKRASAVLAQAKISLLQAVEIAQ